MMGGKAESLGNPRILILKKGVQKAENPKIEVTVEGLGAGTAFLIGTFTDQRYRADTATVNANGVMRFTKDEPYKAGLYYIVFDDKTFLQTLVDTDQTFSMKTNKANLVQDMQIKGSLENQLLYENLKFPLPF